MKILENQAQTFLDWVNGYSWMTYNQTKSKPNISSTLEMKLKLAVDYIESQCTLKCAFLTQVSMDKEQRHSTIAIPNNFDSALILNICHGSGIELSPDIKSRVRQLLWKDHSSCGQWNFFQNGYKIIPNDIDTSSNVLLGLIACGSNPDEAMGKGEALLEAATFHNDGLVDIYYGMSEDLDDSDVVGKWPCRRRIDLVSTANFLYMLNELGVEHLPKARSCYDLMANALTAILNNDYENPVIASYAKSYKDVDVICFFFSRVVAVSDHARDMLKTSIATIVRERLLSDNSNPIHIACRVMAAVNTGLLEIPECRSRISKELNNLFNLQNKDFGFPSTGLYNAHGVYQFGSPAMSSAFAAAAMSMVKNNAICLEIL